MDVSVYIARLLFWVVAGLVCLGPKRRAVFCLLLLAQLDASGPEFASASSLGVENALKVVVVPTILLLRIGPAAWKGRLSEPFARLWIALISYAVVASIWSPFRLSALKMAGYLYCYAVIYLILRYASEAGWITSAFVKWGLLVASVLALVQTYMLGDVYGSLYEGDALRLTTFSDPQGFAAYLLCMAAVLLTLQYKKGSTSLFTVVVIVAAVFMTGSRYVSLGLVIALIIVAAFRAIRAGRFSARKLVLQSTTVLVIAVAALVLVLRAFPDNRIAELVEASAQQGSYEDIGTLVWRLGIYGEALQQIEDRGASTLAFGSGTSSGANVVLGSDPKYAVDTVDANRVVHNEFLRAFYEWGLLGFAIFVCFLAASIHAVWRLARNGSLNAIAFLAVAPALLLGLAIENILANAAGAAGIGFTLVFAHSLVRPTVQSDADIDVA